MKPVKSIGLIVFLIFGVITCSCNLDVFKSELYAAKFGDKWGFVDGDGKYIINPQFSEVQPFIEGLALVTTSTGKKGYINEEGQFVIPAQYKWGTSFSDGLAIVVPFGEAPVCIDKTGKISFRFDNTIQKVYGFSEERCFYEDKNGKLGIMSDEGKVISNPQFDEARYFSEGLAPVAKRNTKVGETDAHLEWGAVNKDGKLVIPFQFSSMNAFSEGLAAIQINGKWGFINDEGKIVINPQFDNVLFFHEGLAPVKQGEVWGYINKTGKLVINPQFDEAFGFKDKLAVIAQDNKYGLINNDGQIIVNPQFDLLVGGEYGKFVAQSGEKAGLVNAQGEYLINPQFDSMFPQFEAIKRVVGIYGSVRSDYYDTSAFISNMGAKMQPTMFDGYSYGSNLQTMTNNIMPYDVIMATVFTATLKETLALTPDINYSINWRFEVPYYKRDTDMRLGINLNYTAPIKYMRYSFKLNGEAYGHGYTLAIALRDLLEKNYSIKMKESEGGYTHDSSSSFSYKIHYEDYSLTLWVGLGTNTLMNVKNKDNDDSIGVIDSVAGVIDSNY